MSDRANKRFGIGLQSPAWAIYRRIGMSGKLLGKGIAREHGRTVSDAVIKKLDEQHTSLFRELAPDCATLSRMIAHGIATSGKRSEIEASLKALSLSPAAVVIDGDMVREVKPEPDPFLLCQEELNVDRSQWLVVGDAVWDVHA